MIALIDYGAGNLTSVRKAFTALGADVRRVVRPGGLEGAAGIVVPGVGHFEATAALDGEWRAAVRGAVAAGRPLLGICLGMQWLFEGSDEAPALAGLGVCRGRCTRLQPGRADLKVPHVGWSALEPRGQSALLDGVPAGEQMYFTHSYAAPVTRDCIARTSHGGVFASAVARDRVWGVQFHPEKSGAVGLRVLENFVRLAEIGFRHSSTRGFPRSSTSNRSVSRSDPEPDPRSHFGPASAPSKRIIACLDVRDGRVVKGVRFGNLREAGDPAALARRHERAGVDELVLLDVTATLERRRALAETVAAVSRVIFIPLAVGGGIRSADDAAAVLDAGADKVSLNSAALADPGLIGRLAVRYGSQAVLVAIDAKRDETGWAVYSRSGTAPAGRGAVAWAREAVGLGAGEILLTSMDRDGTREGFDCDLTAAVSRAVSVPVIASGGAGEPAHFVEVFTTGAADAALAASIFHFSEQAVADLKWMLHERGIPVRLVGDPGG